MLKLRFYKSLLKKNFSTCNDILLAQCLTERTFLRISGNDSSAFLQGLITNDMKHLLDGAPSMFTLFLNNKGRILYDTIIYNSGKENTYLIECDARVSSFLQSHLFKYKVRRKLVIDRLNDEIDLWAVVNKNSLENLNQNFDYKKIMGVIKQNNPDLIVANDPRLSFLGLRIIVPKYFNFLDKIKETTTLKAEKEDFYKLIRYKLGIGEGIQELPPEKSFPLEANGDYLHGISFHKGCYLGQELTARTYHTGVIRKRLMPLVFNEEIEVNVPGIPIFAVSESTKSIGKLQGVEQTNGVGLLRIEEALSSNELEILGKKCTTHRPFWWPNEAPKERMNAG